MTPAPAPYLRNLVRFGLPGVVLALGLLFTLGIWRHDRSVNQREINAYFDYRSRDAVARVEARLRTYEQALLSARGLFQANEEVTRKGFATFVAGVDVDKHYPGIQGIGFALVVPASELDRHLVQIRGQGFPDYSLRPEGKRAVYSSIIYLEPFKERNLRAFGYDMFAEPVRQEAMRRATDSGGPALSGKVQLVQETDQAIQAGFLLYVPVYQNGRATQTIEDRRRNLIGWVYAPFRMNDFMLGVLGEGEPDLDLEVFDGPGAKAGTQMFDRDPAHAAGALALPKARQNLSFAGHSWTVVIQALPGLLARHGQDTTLTVLGLGSLVSLLLGLTAFLLARHLDRVRTLNATLEQKVQERTQALGESEEAFRTVADYTYDWELWEDPGGALRYCSPSCERITSYPPDAFRADPNLAMRLVHPEDSAKWQAHRAMVHAATGPEVAALMNGEELEFRLLRPDGEVRWIGHVCHPIHDAAGHFRGHRISNRDITERKQAELALRESDIRFQLMADHAPVLIWISGPDKLCTYFNKVWLDFTGRTLAQEQGNGWAEGVHPDDLKRCLDIYLGHSDQRLAFNMDYRLRHADGSYRWLTDHGVPRFDAEGAFQGYIGSCVDITERKQVENALRTSEESLAITLQSIGDAVIATDVAGLITRMNPAAERLTGWPSADAQGRPLPEIFRIINAQTRLPSVNPVQAVLAHGEVVGLANHTVLLARGGQEYQIADGASPIRDAAGRVLGVVLVFSDVTAQYRVDEENVSLQAQLQQSQKMESLGILAGGVAHDMNNVLGAILGLASAHIGTLPSGSPLHQALDTICKAAVRGGQMVKSLLSFARHSPAENHKLDMNAILKEQIALLERTTLAKVQLEIDLEAELRPIQGDASALTHAFMNLCINAVDAMPENGTLTLHTRNVDNDWIEVVVEDNGMGMPKEVLEKALDPFFTTKETGKGTGLGLSMVYSTVKAHRGQMSIQSEPGNGTRVMLRFPAFEQEPPVQVAEPAVAKVTLPPQGALKVLLVDDDDLIQSSVQAILEVLGYTAVTTAQSGEEALAALEAGFEPDLVILDMNMPGLGGIGTLPRLRVLRPAVPVLLSTGRTDQTALNLASAHLGVTLLSKPFGLRELQKHLESIGLG